MCGIATLTMVMSSTSSTAVSTTATTRATDGLYSLFGGSGGSGSSGLMIGGSGGGAEASDAAAAPEALFLLAASAAAFLRRVCAGSFFILGRVDRDRGAGADPERLAAGGLVSAMRTGNAASPSPSCRSHSPAAAPRKLAPEPALMLSTTPSKVAPGYMSRRTVAGWPTGCGRDRFP